MTAISVIIESLSNEDGNGIQNVNQKVNSRCFTLHRSYCNSFNSSNIGVFFQELNSIKDCIYVHKKKKKSFFFSFVFFWGGGVILIILGKRGGTLKTFWWTGGVIIFYRSFSSNPTIVNSMVGLWLDWVRLTGSEAIPWQETGISHRGSRQLHC